MLVATRGGSFAQLLPVQQLQYVYELQSSVDGWPTDLYPPDVDRGHISQGEGSISCVQVVLPEGSNSQVCSFSVSNYFLSTVSL